MTADMVRKTQSWDDVGESREEVQRKICEWEMKINKVKHSNDTKCNIQKE